MWHCPHCGAPQAETARCWVCRRSSTTCSTCRHFRASLAADVGYCALDRHRRPLTGLELRGCWAERRPAAPGSALMPPDGGHRSPPPAATPDPEGWSPGSVPARGFVPVEDVERPPVPDAGTPAPTFLLGEPPDAWDGRTSLFGEPER